MDHTIVLAIEQFVWAVKRWPGVASIKVSYPINARDLDEKELAKAVMAAQQQTGGTIEHKVGGGHLILTCHAPGHAEDAK